MTNDESAALMADVGFRGRVKVCCLRFAMSIQNESASMQGHTARARWADGCYKNPDMVSGQVVQPTVMDPNVQSQGAAIADDLLQGAVEATVNSFF